MTPAYRLTNVTRTLNGAVVLCVDGLDLAHGTVVGLTGPNGAGKSTLLRLLAFLDRPDSGTIAFMGKATVPSTSLRRRVALLTQTPYLLKRTVFQNVAYGLRLRGENDPRQSVSEALRMVGLAPDEFRRRSWRELSGGEVQRVALAARLALRPEVLLLDEPTTHLDEESSQLVLNAAVLARDRWGSTIIAASHDRVWLDSACDRILTLRRGRVEE